MGDDVPCRRWLFKCFWEWLFSYFVYFSCVRKSWWRREYISMIINHELPFETVPVIIHGQYTSSRTSNVEASGTLQRRRTYTHCSEYHRCLTQCWIRAQPILGTLVGNLRKAAPNSESPSQTERQRRSWTSRSGGSFKWSSSTSEVSSNRFSSRPDLIRRKESPCKWRQTNSTCLVQLPDPSRQESVPFSTWRILLDMRKPSMPGMPPRKIGHIF